MVVRRAALVMAAVASLAVAGSFLLAGVLMEKPAAKVSGSVSDGFYGCGITKTPTTCGPVPDPVWPTAGATIGVVLAVVFLLAAALRRSRA